MKNNAKRLLFLILFNFIGGALMLLPIIGAGWNIKEGRWIITLLFILSFFIIRQILHVVENRLDIRSPSNPESRYKGSGITFIAPWLKHKQNRIEKVKKDKE